MWEDATPKPMPETAEHRDSSSPAPAVRRSDGKTQDNLILWAQILLCAAILAGGFPCAGTWSSVCGEFGRSRPPGCLSAPSVS